MKIGMLIIAWILFSWGGVELNLRYKKTNHYKNQVWQIAKFKNVPENIQIAAVGSGPGLYDISFDGAKQKGFNFCMSPQPFEYAYKILKKYQGKIDKGATLIIVVCPLSFANNLQLRQKNFYDLYYYFLKPSEIKNYTLRRKIALTFPLLRHPKKVLKIFRDVPEQEFLTEDNTLNHEEMAESVKNGIQGWLNSSQLKDLKDGSQAENHKEIFKQKGEFLKNILELCESNSWNPVFVMPPMCEGISEQISDSFITKFVTEQLEWVNYLKAPVLNYFRDPEFSQDKYYRECYFMNVTGRKKFSEQLFHDINKIQKT